MLCSLADPCTCAGGYAHRQRPAESVRWAGAGAVGALAEEAHLGLRWALPLFCALGACIATFALHLRIGVCAGYCAGLQ